MTATPATIDTVLPFDEEQRNFAVRQARIGCWLVLLCMPLGLLLDYFVYPAELLHFFVIARLGCDVLVLPLFLLLRGDRATRHVGWIGLVWPLLPAVAITYMIAVTEGAGSPYYAGLILVIIVACVLMPYRWVEAFTVCAATLGIYLVGCLVHWLTPMSTMPTFAQLFSNLYFLSVTSLICVVSAASHFRRRQTDHALRSEVARANTNLADANERIAESYRQLSELDKLKNDFFANVSHEFRLPLTLILTPVDDLLTCKRNNVPVERGTLTLIRNNAVRLLRLINDLLDVIRLDRTKLELNIEPIDLGRFVRGSVDAMRLSAKQHGLQLNVAGDEGAVVEIDPARFERVVLNLLSNAIKFTPIGGSVSVDWSVEDYHVELRVADTGCGIPEADLGQVFERFHQVDSSSTREHQGLGIGLALTKDLVESHGGSIWANSEHGRGTTMHVRLPLAPAGTEPVATAPVRSASVDDPLNGGLVPTTHASASPDDTQQGDDRPLVLVVDDEPDMRRYLTDLLRPSCQVVEAADGEAALALIQTGSPMLVLLDLMMPKLDGRQVVRRLIEDRPPLMPKVVLLTADANPEVKLELLAEGVDDFLTKPFNAAEVRTRVANLIDRGKLERELARSNQQLSETLVELQEKEQQLIQSAKMNALGKLAAGLLHEVNNPVNYMNMAIEHARASVEDDSDLGETIRDLHDGLKQIESITSDLRAFAYPSTNLQTEDFAIGEAFRLARRMCAAMVGAARISIEGGDLHVRAPRSHLTQVLNNLMVNAAAAVPDGVDPVIRVVAVQSDDRVVVEVHDPGPGIPEEIRDRVVEPFYTTKDVGEGTGLGLSVCHTIINGWDGALTFEKTDTSFCVRFDVPAAAEPVHTTSFADYDDQKPEPEQYSPQAVNP
ncbi:MAG: ATP-binding protein [Planctomycetota bacterium]